METTDAKGRWCPFARALFSDEDGAAGINRRGDKKPEEFAPCIGGRCMAWRVHPEPETHYGKTEGEADEMTAEARYGFYAVEGEGQDEGGVERFTVSFGAQGGYCGMAGREGAL